MTPILMLIKLDYKIHHDDHNIINPSPNQPKYKEAEITKIADNILLYQRNNGGWPKNYDVQAILTHKQADSLVNTKNMVHTTFDNSTTYTHAEDPVPKEAIVKRNADSNKGRLRPNLSLTIPESTAPKTQPISAELIAHARAIYSWFLNQFPYLHKLFL